MTTAATTTTTTTSAQILHHTSTFIVDVLSQSDLRRQVFTTLSRKILPDQIIVKPLTVAVETIENAISTKNPATRISSLRLVEKLLQSYPENVFSALILSLVYGLRQCPINAALSLLDVFYLDPLSARSEIAPILFEDLFLLHLIPVLQGFNDCRSRILSSKPPDKNQGRSRRGKAMDNSQTKLLSGVSKIQGKKLKNLEKDYEEVLDQNCKAFAGYLKEILEDKDGTRSISPPPLILTKFSDEGEVDFDSENKLKLEDIKMSNGRYNVMSHFPFYSSIDF
ncbi:Ring-type e3 ubiquitin transferase [Thalictrum thalictroides]|uniref:Ring-type e3 ubiquitin transferase n=1 Tax=Thalictrum thalictroides TaxID=46969 RepID=A0A7J6WKG3_THATH|nr:Ring-type e3 ubiquitin transferase [Thalictrum thalictroides]